MKNATISRRRRVPESLPVTDTGRRVALHLSNTRRELSDVSVVDDNGVVQLSGVLPSFYLRQLAVACARRVAGVQRVVDNMQVAYMPSACAR